MATDSHPWRAYTEAERADAVGLALAMGTKQAAAKLGIPRRTLSSWVQRPTAEVQAAISRSRDDVAARLWEAVTTGTEAVLAGLRDPKGRLGDKANALRIVVEAHALITGGATARTENLNVNADADWTRPLTDDEAENVRQSFDEMTRLAALPEDELEAWLLTGKGDSNADAPPGLKQLHDFQVRVMDEKYEHLPGVDWREIYGDKPDAADG